MAVVPCYTALTTTRRRWGRQFLVNRAGQPIKRYPPAMDGGVLKSLERDLNGMLNV